MIFSNLNSIKDVENGYDYSDIEEDQMIPSDPMTTVTAPSEFLIGRPFAHKVCTIEVEEEAEIYAVVNNRSMGDHFYLREEEQVVKVGNGPLISRTPKMDWPDLVKNVRKEEREEYNGQDTINTERWAWRSALGNEEPELYSYIIGL